MRIFARFLEFPGWRTRAMRAANRGRAEAPQERLGIAPPYQDAGTDSASPLED
jgi:hypothetical protein